MFNLFKNKKEDNFLALDIGTEYVKALTFSFDKENSRIVIRNIIKERQNPKNMAGGMITDIEGVSKTCKRALSRIENAAGMKFSNAIVGVAGESVRGGVATVNYERLNPNEKITNSEVKNIIQKSQWRAFDKFRKDFADDTGRMDCDVRIVDAQILRSEIDGYVVNNPAGFQGKNVTFEIFNSIAPLVHLESIHEVLGNLGLKVGRIAAEPCAIANLACSLQDTPKRALFIDIGGGTTDIAVVKDGAINAVRMFSMGGRAISKRISSMLGIGDTEAEDIKIKYSNGKLGRDAASSIKSILKEDTRIWAKGVKFSLEKFFNRDFFPSAIYLCGGGCLLPEIKEVLQTSFSGRPVDINFLFPEVFSEKISDKNNILSDTSDIASLGLANLVQSWPDDFIGQTLKRIVKLTQSY